MASTIEVKVPDIGDFHDVEIIEVAVSAGDEVEAEQTLITLESDKAALDVPSPKAGRVAELQVALGDRVSEGDVILTLEVGEGAAADAAPPASSPAPEKRDESEGQDENEEKTKGKKDAGEERKGRGGEANGDDRPRRSPAAATKAEREAAPAAERGAARPPAGAGEDEPVRARDKARHKADLETDVVVLGAGPGGYTAAFRAADLGLRTVLVERYPQLGGVCLNVGCIPSKALLHTAEVLHGAAAMAEHGIRFGAPEIDLGRLAAWKDQVVGQLTRGLAGLAKQRKVQVVQGVGRFADPQRIEVETDEGTRTIGFEHAIIAAGSQAARIPSFPDDPRIMDSTDALRLERIPERLLVVGGGIIGLEMATVYHALGSRITVVEMLDQLMPGTDPEIVRPFHKRVEKQYAAIWLGTKVAEVKAEKDGLEVRFEGPKAPERELFDGILVAVGRTPNGKRIGAEHAGVQVDDRGFIASDRQQRTNVPHIFAIGDLTTGPMLAHKATHQGKVAAEVAAGHKAGFDALAIPSVAYTDPEVAWTGKSEAECKEEGIPYEKATFPWAASGRSLGMGRSEGLTKVLFHAETRRLLGAAIVGPHAGDLIAEATLALEMGADPADIGLTIHPHPTLSETFAFAAEMVDGTITDLYAPRKGK